MGLILDKIQEFFIFLFRRFFLGFIEVEHQLQALNEKVDTHKAILEHILKEGVKCQDCPFKVNFDLYGKVRPYNGEDI